MKSKILIILSLIFVFTLSLFSIVPQIHNLDSTVKAETVETVDGSKYISPELLSYIDEAVASGQAETFDYFSYDPKYYDEWVILYDYSFNPIAVNGKEYYLLTCRTSHYIHDDNQYFITSANVGLQVESSTSSTITGNKTTVFSNGYDNASYSTDIYSNFHYTYTRYPSYVRDPLINDGFFRGSMYEFNDHYQFYWEMPEALQTSSNPAFGSTLRAFNISEGDTIGTPLFTLLGYPNYASIPTELIFSYIDFKFITLKSLIQYAYSNGYEDNSYAIYGSFSNATITANMIFESYNDPNLPDQEFTVSNIPVTKSNGFISFDNLAKYELCDIVNGELVPNGEDWFWTGGSIILNLEIPVYYDQPYFYKTGASEINTFALFVTTVQNTNIELFSELDDSYRIKVVNPVGFVNAIEFAAGRGWDSVQQIEMKDFSPQSTVDYNKGYVQGFDSGKSQGYTEGYGQGLDTGYRNGFNDAQYSNNIFYSFFSAIFDVPVQTFLNLFSIELFGVDLSGFFISLLAISILIALVKFFLNLNSGN